MSEFHLTKLPGGTLTAADDLTAQRIRRLPIGAPLVGKFSQPRNPKFHRKYFALLNYLFDLWEPEAAAWNDQPAVKNFDRFRKDLAIQCGFYELTVNIKGDVRAEAKSIRFAEMDEGAFSELYNKTITFALQSDIARTQTRESIEQAVDQILSFAA